MLTKNLKVMKKYVIIALSVILSFFVFAQSNAQNRSGLNKMVSPLFKGDQNISAIRSADNATLMNNYLLKHVSCPESAAKCCKEGTEIVQFTVTASGDLKDFKVINSVCSELDNEIIRVLKTTNGNWTPGLEDGKPVPMTKEVAFMFGDHISSTIAEYFVKTGTVCYNKGSKNLLVKNKPKKALPYLNAGINYMPNDKAMLSLRGLCHFALGDEESARKDWERVTELGGIIHGVNLESLTELKGYEEMTKILAEK
jgi:hypothetical protein